MAGIAATAAGLIVALIVSGLTAAAEVATLVLVVPLGASAIRWMRSDHDRSPASGSAAMPAEFAGQMLAATNSSLPAIPGITFRAPLPWRVLQYIWIPALLAACGGSVISSPDRPSRVFGEFLLGAGMAGFGIIVEESGSRMRAHVAPKLVVNQAGIYYRWNARREIAYPLGEHHRNQRGHARRQRWQFAL